MLHLILLIVTCGLFCMAPVKAGDLNTAHRELVGLYEVSSQRELATRLELAREGRFSWSLSYGDTDAYISGKWEVAGKQVLLTADAPEPLQIEVAQIEKVTPRWLPKAGYWVVIISGAERARLPPVDIEFIAQSGASASAATRERGDASVRMAADQVWAQVRIRPAGSADAWTTLTVPNAIAERRLAILSIKNLQSLRPPVFTTLALDIRGHDLGTAAGGPLDGLMYSRTGASSARPKDHLKDRQRKQMRARRSTT